MIARAYAGAAAVVAVGAALLYLRGVRQVAADVAGGAVDMADDVLAGTVEGVGGAFGLPATDSAACDAALSAGDTWAASFACPASRWIGHVFGG